MTAALLLLLQAATATPPERIDLTLTATAAGCKGPAGDEVVVCGGRARSYRLQPLEREPRLMPIPKAEVKLFGGKAAAAVETEAAAMPNGNTSNRLMARIKLPF